MRILLLLLILTTTLLPLVLPLSLKDTHQFWFDKNSPKVAGNSAKWYYCNLKCLYLENYTHNADFVVIEFTSALGDTFSACYVKTATSYILWNKAISNKFFHRYCGNDSQDWLKMPMFHVKKIYG